MAVPMMSVLERVGCMYLIEPSAIAPNRTPTVRLGREIEHNRKHGNILAIYQIDYERSAINQLITGSDWARVRFCSIGSMIDRNSWQIGRLILVDYPMQSNTNRSIEFYWFLVAFFYFSSLALSGLCATWTLEVKLVIRV